MRIYLDSFLFFGFTCIIVDLFSVVLGVSWGYWNGTIWNLSMLGHLTLYDVCD